MPAAPGAAGLWDRSKSKPENKVVLFFSIIKPQQVHLIYSVSIFSAHIYKYLPMAKFPWVSGFQQEIEARTFNLKAVEAYGLSFACLGIFKAPGVQNSGHVFMTDQMLTLRIQKERIMKRSKPKQRRIREDHKKAVT